MCLCLCKHHTDWKCPTVVPWESGRPPNLAAEPLLQSNGGGGGQQTQPRNAESENDHGNTPFFRLFLLFYLNMVVTYPPLCVVFGTRDGSRSQPLDRRAHVYQHNHRHPRGWHRTGPPLTQEDWTGETTVALLSDKVGLNVFMNDWKHSILL